MFQDDHDDPLAHLASIRQDGKRIPMHPMEVTGKRYNIRRVAYVFFLGLWLLLPWIHINGNPAFQMDVVHRQLHLFGQSYNAQDTWLLFFVITGTAFSLFVISALWGRIWCGFACPHTVILEFLYRPVEAFFEGRPVERKRRDLKGFRNWNFNDWLRKLAKWFVYLIWSAGLANCAVAYFISLPTLWSMVQHNPLENWNVFLWMSILTGLFYGNFAWFREQMCLVLCPYGRMQSILADEDTIIVGYDKKRGEPRGRAKKTKNTSNTTETSVTKFGDCIDCHKCVAVCPTGIDIRNGHQIECIGCTACIDACDSIMIKAGKPVGLIRFDSMKGLAQEPKRFWRPRVFLYLAAGLAGLGALTISAISSKPVSITALRLPGSPYTVMDGTIRNAYELHIENKRAQATDLHVDTTLADGFHVISPITDIHLEARKGMHLPIFIEISTMDFQQDTNMHLQISDQNEQYDVDIRFLGPKK